MKRIFLWAGLMLCVVNLGAQQETPNYQLQTPIKCQDARFIWSEQWQHFAIQCVSEHRWASELDAKEQVDGIVWRSHLLPFVEGYDGAGNHKRITLDFCVRHGETRVLQPKEKK